MKKATFQTGPFPANISPKKLTQFSWTTIEESKREELTSAWKELIAALGQESWGGQSVGDGPLVGVGMLGWDSLQVRISSNPGLHSLTKNRMLELLSKSPRLPLLCRSGRILEALRMSLLR